MRDPRIPRHRGTESEHVSSERILRGHLVAAPCHALQAQPHQSQPSPSSSREPKHSSLGEHTGRQTVSNQQDSTCVLGLVIHWLRRIRETEEGKESRKPPRPWLVQLM